MGIVYSVEEDWVEAWTKSISLNMDEGESIEIDYVDFDRFLALVEKAKMVRRDRWY